MMNARTETAPSTPITWHLGLHRAPESLPPSLEIERSGRTLSIFRLDPAAQSLEFPVSFDRFLERLNGEGAYVEGDGSFVWRQGKGVAAPLLDGNAFDGAVALRHVEFKGRGGREAFERMFRLVDWPQVGLVVSIVEEGLMMTAETFLSACVEAD